uniref:Transmembrane protein n=1 Tax=Medicago truncatula TaxID=3880 RepID=Q2HT36_MEDTR|nr:hypothetical protein MtrDRAFT_AC150798g13v2 [Medicago truncatula]
MNKMSQVSDDTLYLRSSREKVLTCAALANKEQWLAFSVFNFFASLFAFLFAFEAGVPRVGHVAVGFEGLLSTGSSLGSFCFLAA